MMRRRFTTTMGYMGAGLTVAAAVMTPFVLMGFFSGAVAHAGLHVSDVFLGGTVARTVTKSGYQIAVYRAVQPGGLVNSGPFVQVTWKPLSALPARVSDEVDLDGDGRPDVRVTFRVPSDPKETLRARIDSLNEGYPAEADVRQQSFSKMILRAGDGILVRVPVSKAVAAGKSPTSGR